MAWVWTYRASLSWMIVLTTKIHQVNEKSKYVKLV